MELQQQIALCRHHESLLVLPRFDADIALELGMALRTLARARHIALAIDISVNRLSLFSCLMPGASAENADWVRRKRNVIDLLGTSSYGARLMLLDRKTTLAERYGVSPRDYAAYGGGFPLRLAGAGIIGSVTVSGAPELADHHLAQEVLAGFAGVDPATLTPLPPLRA